MLFVFKLMINEMSFKIHIKDRILTGIIGARGCKMGRLTPPLDQKLDKSLPFLLIFQ